MSCGRRWISFMKTHNRSWIIFSCFVSWDDLLCLYNILIYFSCVSSLSDHLLCSWRSYNLDYEMWDYVERENLVFLDIHFIENLKFSQKLEQTIRHADQAEKIVSFQLAPASIFNIITCTLSWIEEWNEEKMKKKSVGQKAKVNFFISPCQQKTIRLLLFCLATAKDFLGNSQFNVQSIELNKSFQNQQPLIGGKNE